MNRIVPVLVVFMLAACAGTADRPAWLDGRSAAYPEARYLTATGSAAEPENAKMRALSNLARIFEVQIDETSRDETAAWRRDKDNGVEQGTQQLTVRYVDAYTTKLLEGAEVVEMWRDKKTGRHYALAVIDRARVVRRLSGEIRAADRYAQNRLARAGGRNDPLQSARALWAARRALIEREKLQRDLQIVDATGAGLPPRWTSDDLSARVDAQLERMDVGGRVLSDPVGDLGPSLQAGIAGAGMNPVANEGQQPPDYWLNATLDVKDLGLREGWYWYRGALEVELLERGSEKAMFSHRWPLKASGQSREQARVRLQDQIDRQLQTELKPALLEFGGDGPKQ